MKEGGVREDNREKEGFYEGYERSVGKIKEKSKRK